MKLLIMKKEAFFIMEGLLFLNKMNGGTQDAKG
jgi:hypothetical protein